MEKSSLDVFERLESNVRSYGRDFPTIFSRAKGAEIHDEHGRRYIDFFAGAGALNYGHNPDPIKRALLDYIEADGITHALDKNTVAKRDFLEEFSQVILGPRGLDYKVQFCSPSGANAVEAALKLARKVTKRTGVFSFMGGYHGASLGSLAITGNRRMRAAAGVPLVNTTFIPYPEGPRGAFDSLALIERMLEDSSSGVEIPAAIILETVQLEGGVYVAPTEFLKRLRQLCDKHAIVLICDDIQAGCGRCGSFFSFERAGIRPDLIVLSKSLSGYGLPLAVVLIQREMDVWSRGEHTGTFRAHQLALITGRAALENWKDGTFIAALGEKSKFVEEHLRDNLVTKFDGLTVRGVGMVRGVDLGKWGDAFTDRVQVLCFERGLIIESCGRRGDVLKLIPPLTIGADQLKEGCDILAAAIQETMTTTAA